MTQGGAPKEGGYSDIFIISGHFFWGGGQNFEFQYVCFFMDIFYGYEDLLDIFLGSSQKLDYI